MYVHIHWKSFISFELNCRENRFQNLFDRIFQERLSCFFISRIFLSNDRIASEWIQLEMTNCNSPHPPFSWIFKIKVSAFHSRSQQEDIVSCNECKNIDSKRESFSRDKRHHASFTCYNGKRIFEGRVEEGKIFRNVVVTNDYATKVAGNWGFARALHSSNLLSK